MVKDWRGDLGGRYFQAEGREAVKTCSTREHTGDEWSKQQGKLRDEVREVWVVGQVGLYEPEEGSGLYSKCTWVARGG